jgi:hypothetical protein
MNYYNYINNATGVNNMTNLLELFNKNNSFISRQISLSKYIELLKAHNVSFQGSDSATRSELAKTLSRKGILLN